MKAEVGLTMLRLMAAMMAMVMAMVVMVLVLVVMTLVMLVAMMIKRKNVNVSTKFILSKLHSTTQA